MYLNDLIYERGITKYRLSKESGVPQTTIIDICSEKSKIKNCAAGTLYKIAKALNISMESLIAKEVNKNDIPHRSSFEVFKSNVCHLVKDKGDVEFIIDTLSSDEIRTLYNRRWYAEAFYMLAMIDYLSRENSIPICTNYNDIRSQKLKDMIYPSSAVISDAAMNTTKHCEECLKNAIPEFLRFNIVEGEIRNVC